MSGLVRLGLAWLGLVWLGRALVGILVLVGVCGAWLGSVGLDLAWSSMLGFGQAGTSGGRDGYIGTYRE